MEDPHGDRDRHPVRRRRISRPARWLGGLVLAACCLGPPPTGAVVCASGGTSAGPPLTAQFLRGYRASFHAPARLAVDDLGRIYVADAARGAVLVRSADGRIASLGENLGRPSSVAADAAGNRIFVGDGVDGRVTVYTPGWLPLYDLGQGAGEFAVPGDIAIDPATGNAWVTDSAAHTVGVYSPTGERLFRFGGRGDAAGQFQAPAGIFVDAAAGEVLVADQLNGRVQIFDLAGGFKSCIGVKGTGPGRFNLPLGVWADELGRIFVSDAFEGWVHVVDRQGASVAFLGGVGDLGVGAGRLTTPTDLIIDPSGRLFVSGASTARLDVFGLDAYADPERFAPAEVALAPQPLDPAAAATVTAVIEVPGYRIGLLAAETVTANGALALAGSADFGDADGDLVPDLSVAFDASAVAATLPPTGGSVRVTGQLGELEIEGFDDLQVVAPADGDGDGVDDPFDSCPATPPGSPVDEEGCSVDQLCPCSGPRTGGSWKNHGQYVACVARAVREITGPPLDEEAIQALVRAAARSSCGRKPEAP